MNVASLELCKELYELSEWNDPDAPSEYSDDHKFQYSRYTLGYLLRKLPKGCSVYYIHNKDDFYTSEYKHDKAGFLTQGTGADTPEDAACKLAIELFKQKVLVKDTDVSLPKGGNDD